MLVVYSRVDSFGRGFDSRHLHQVISYILLVVNQQNVAYFFPPVFGLTETDRNIIDCSIFRKLQIAVQMIKLFVAIQLLIEGI